ncbi:glycosyltransferase [Microbacterium sp. K41]|uniref:glycosyltransferase n=1 Tax=Microbacterium sp. K41 TaxID=2305437 RepID=UPI001F101409|nr:glycosyltransferase [Microbacterium sp. K41]
MRHTIVLATTVDVSLTLLRGFPEFLVSRGWDVHIVSSGGPRLSALSTLEGVTVHVIPMRRAPSPIADATALFAWLRLLRRVRPTVVSLGTPKASLLGLVAARMRRVPVRQYLLRGLRLHTTRGVLRTVLRLSERTAMAMATDVVAVSGSLRAEALSLKLNGRRDIAVVGGGSSNGIDLTQFAVERFDADARAALAASLDLRPAIPVVGFVGRLTRDKGIDTLLLAVEEMQAHGTAVELLLIGGYDDDEAERWIRDARDRGLHVTVVDHVADPAPYIALFDIACIPSLREGFCNAAAEASAMGVPVVGTRVTGMVDPIRDGVTGLLSAAGDHRALARHLTALVVDPARAEALGAAGAAFIRENYERTTVQGRYEARLQALASGRNA